MKVSIIIPVYGAEQYIATCVTSVLNQSYPDIEMILVDDCSPDNSMQVAQKVIDRHPRRNCVKMLSHKRNQGQSCARNNGIEAATGDYIYLLDSDDFLPADAIQLLVQQSANGQADLVLGNYETRGDKRPFNELLKLHTGILKSNKAILKSFYHGQWYVMACNMLIKRSFIQNHNLRFYPGILHEDELWNFQLATLASTMGIVNDTTYYYVLHKGAITSSITQRHFDGLLEVVAQMHRHITANPQLMHNKYAMSIFEKKKFRFLQKIYKRSDNAAYVSQAFMHIKRLYFKHTPLCLPQRIVTVCYQLPGKAGYKLYRAFEWFYYKWLRLKFYLGYA